MEVRRSPRKKSPSPISSSVYTTSSGSTSSDSSEEDTQEKRKPKGRDYKPSHAEPGSNVSCSSASSTPKKKRRRKESPEKEETVRSESEDGSRSDPLELQSNLSGVPRKRNQLRSSRQARWRKGLTEVAVRDYDHSMVKGFLKQVSARQRKNFSVESWDSDDISSDDNDDDGDDDDDNSPLREEEEEEVPVAKVVPNETFIERLQRETLNQKS